jgi:hypothetical protein
MASETLAYMTIERMKIEEIPTNVITWKIAMLEGVVLVKITVNISCL